MPATESPDNDRPYDNNQWYVSKSKIEETNKDDRITQTILIEYIRKPKPGNITSTDIQEADYTYS